MRNMLPARQSSQLRTGFSLSGLGQPVTGEQAVTRWQLQDAKNRLSDVVRRTRQDGPQTITVRGRDAVVLISVEEYEELTRPKQSLIEFFRESPLRGVELDVERDRDPGRDVRL